MTNGADLSAKGIGPEPVIARWELWSVATMLVAALGDGAEAHAREEMKDAEDREQESEAIVWQGVLTQLGVLRSAT